MKVRPARREAAPGEAEAPAPRFRHPVTRQLLAVDGQDVDPNDLHIIRGLKDGDLEPLDDEAKAALTAGEDAPPADPAKSKPSAKAATPAA